MSAAVITGLAGAGVAYEIAAGGDSSTTTSVADTSTATTGRAGEDAVKSRFAPCKKPAVLEKGACVTDVVRTVVLSGARLGVSARQSGADDGPSHDAFDDHGDDGPLHDAFDDHGDDFDEDDAFDDHGGDEVEDGEDHSGPGGSDSDDSAEDHSGHGGGDDD